MIPLAVCSILALAVILERSLFWIRESRRRNPKLIQEVLALAEREDYEEIRRRTQGAKDYIVRMLVSGLVHREFSLTSAMEVAAQEQLNRMRRHLSILDTLITLCPMLGILGTVTGIIQSFDLLGHSGMQDPRAVTMGIAQALITTAAGLSIALACLIPFNYFHRRIEKAAAEMETYGTSLEILYQKVKHHEVNRARLRPEGLEGEFGP
jgi:biopolymer transport protein ExbB